MKFPSYILGIIFKQMKRGESLKKTFVDELDKYKTIRDIYYLKNNNNKNVLSIYMPSLENDKKHLIIDIHGGAYKIGNSNTNVPFLLQLLHFGYTIINIDYRNKTKDGEVTIKDQCQDVIRAIEFIVKNKNVYSLPNTWTLMGDSAGGHLALFALLHLQEKYAKPLFDSLVLSSPVYDYELLYQHCTKIFTKKALLLIFSNETEQERKLYNPKKYLSSKYQVPTFVISSSKDFLKEQSDELVHDLKNNRVRHEYYFLKTKKNKFGHIFNQQIGKKEIERQLANIKMMNFIDENK